MAEEATPGYQRGTTARVVAVNTLWGASGRLLGGVLAVVTLAVLSRALGPKTYGDYATALAFFYVFSAVADLGIYQILVRDLGKPGKDEGRAVGTALTIRITAVIAALLIGYALFRVIPQYAGIQSLGLISAMVYVPLSLGQVLMAVFQKHLAVRDAAVIEVFTRGLQAAGVFWLASEAFFSAKPYLLILLGTTLLQFFLLSSKTKKLVTIRFGGKGSKQMLKDALPVGISLIFTLIYFRMDTVLLSLFQDSEAVGIYNLAYKVLEQLIFLPAMFIGVLTPIMTRLYTENKTRFKRITEEAAKMILLAILPIVIGGWFLRKHIILLLGGSQYTAAADALAPLLGAVALIYIGTLLGALVIITERQRRAVRVYAGAMVLSVGLNIAVIPTYSYVGAAWTTVVTEIAVVTGLAAVLLGTGVSLKVRMLDRVFFAAAIMTAPLLFTANLTTAVGHGATLLIYLVLSPILYGATLVKAGVIRTQDIKALFRPKTA